MNNILSGAEPIWLRGKAKTGVLCIHGFTGSPWDFKELGSFLNKQGYWISAPLLSGHGTSPAELSQTHWQDWLEDVEQAYLELAKKCANIFVVGISLGANLGMMLATKHPVAGIVSVGGNLSVKPFYRVLITLAPVLRLFVPYYKKTYQETRLDDKVRKQRIGYNVLPLKNARDVGKIISQSRKILPRLDCSVLVLHTHADHAVSQKTIKIFQQVLKEKFRMVDYAQGYHVLLVDPRVKKQVLEEIGKWVSSQTNQTNAH